MNNDIFKMAAKQHRHPLEAKSFQGCITAANRFEESSSYIQHKALTSGIVRGVDKPQIADLKNQVLYTFGESTIEVDMQKAVDGSFPFERVSKTAYKYTPPCPVKVKIISSTVTLKDKE